MIDLDTVHRAMRYAHVAVGCVGLALFWVPVFAAKGSRLHISCGRLFVWCAYFVGFTGLVASVWGLVDPPSFFGDPEVKQVSARALPYLIERARFLFSITGFLALAVLAGAHFGVRLVRTRRDHAQLRSASLLFWEGLLLLWSLALAAFGVYSFFACFTGNHLLPPAAAGRFAIPAALGLWGTYTVVDELKYIFRPRPTPMAWWYRHMESMLGAGIAFHTAFLVFGTTRLLKLQLDGAWQLVPWLLPSAIGIPATIIWVGYYERKLEGPDQPDGDERRNPEALS